MRCCGKDVETPLCPYCGNPNIGAGPSLLCYINDQIASLRRCKDDWSKDRVKQWESWRQFVATAIKAQPETNSESIRPLYHWKCTCGRNNNPTRKSCWKCGEAHNTPPVIRNSHGRQYSTTELT